MEKNVGTHEGHVRTIAAAVLVLIAFFVITNPYIRITLALIAGVLAVTAFVHTCPINHMIGRNTCGPVKATSGSAASGDADAVHDAEGQDDSAKISEESRESTS